MFRLRTAPAVLAGAAVVLAMCVFVGLVGVGCGATQQVVNQNPTANAGTDQTVQVGSAVNLTGAASSDPDGNALTFAWTQTAGTNVTLTGDTTSTPSFTAPNTAGTLTFQLSVNDGNGGTATDTVNVVVQMAPVVNQNPIANAGTDQTVQVGSAVNLDGSASSDPDGNPLTFAWTETAGTNVALTGAATATPSFTAPAAPETLTFQLAVDDGNAGTDTDTVDVIVQAAPTTPRLFIANFPGANITSYANPATVNGNVAPDTNLAGAQTQLASPTDIVVTGDGRLLVCNFGTPSVTGYDDAENTNGNLAPNSNVQGAATLIDDPLSLAINTAQDLTFVADAGVIDRILVYSGSSTSAFNGNLAPTRTIQSAALNDPLGINFGANDELYVANSGDNNVLVFANASNLTGNVAPTRVLTNAAFGNLFDVYVDSSDRLFVVNSATGRIDVFSNASTLNGAVSPSVQLTVPGAAFLTAVAVDNSGNGYIVDNGDSAVYSYNNIATRNGALPPDRTIQGAATQLFGPIRVFLVE